MGVDVLTSSVVGAIGLCVGCASAATDKYSYMATTPDDAKPAPLPKSNRPAATAKDTTPRCRRRAEQRARDAAPTIQYNTVRMASTWKYGTPSVA